MTKPKAPEQAREFPSWPFNLTKFYDHLGHDADSYICAMARATGQAWTVDERYGMKLWEDWAEAYRDLLFAPWASAIRVFTHRPAAVEMKTAGPAVD